MRSKFPHALKNKFETGENTHSIFVICSTSFTYPTALGTSQSAVDHIYFMVKVFVVEHTTGR